jgi:hypothetical protein
VDPTSVGTLPDWIQDDYREFWARVIERYAARVVFANGWEYSHGCAYEYLTASRLSIPALDEEWMELDLPRGLAMLQSASRDFRRRGDEREGLFLENVITALLEMCTTSALAPESPVADD